jgi:hypothetical protein
MRHRRVTTTQSSYTIINAIPQNMKINPLLCGDIISRQELPRPCALQSISNNKIEPASSLIYSQHEERQQSPQQLTTEVKQRQWRGVVTNYHLTTRRRIAILLDFLWKEAGRRHQNPRKNDR